MLFDEGMADPERSRTIMIPAPQSSSATPPRPNACLPDGSSGAVLLARIKHLCSLEEPSEDDMIVRGVLTNRMRMIYRAILRYEQTR